MKHSHERRHQLPFRWPDPPLNVVLVEPEIPQNTGNIARLCAATGSPLHLVGQLGFHLTSNQLRRAGLDYWDSVVLKRWTNWEEFVKRDATGLRVQGSGCWFFSTRAQASYTSVQYQPGDCLVFGSESKGLPDSLLEAYPDHVLAVPMQVDHVRSLNLATTTGIVLYEALRQVQAKD